MKRLVFVITLLTAVSVIASGCKRPEAAAKTPGAQMMPVQTLSVKLAPVQQSSDFVATVKSRRSATLMPQVDGNLTRILVRSGDHVRSGQPLMEIDPRRQQALVDAQKSTENQKKAVYDYDTIEVERQRKLFAAGVTSRDTLDQAEQAYNNSRADWQSAIATRKSLEQELDYYNVKAPFDGIVGDIPVHLGDYVTSSTTLTTVDENKDLEAYIYVPTERSYEVRTGLPVQILDADDKVIEKTSVDFYSPQVDSQLQGILLKAPVHTTTTTFRTAQLVKARVIWKTTPQPLVPVLAVSRLGGQTFVFIAQKQGDGHYVARQTPIALGDTVGDDYAVDSGLKEGDKVIVSGTQFLVDNVPVVPVG